jgi:hypothetical protein
MMPGLCRTRWQGEQGRAKLVAMMEFRPWGQPSRRAGFTDGATVYEGDGSVPRFRVLRQEGQEADRAADVAISGDAWRNEDPARTDKTAIAKPS